MCKITDIKGERKKKKEKKKKEEEEQNTIVITACGDKMTSKRERVEKPTNKKQTKWNQKMRYKYGRSEIARLRLSTPVVRRDQDGGHCSESRAQRFSFFRRFSILLLSFASFALPRNKQVEQIRSTFPPPPWITREGREQIALHAWTSLRDTLDFVKIQPFIRVRVIRFSSARAVISGGSGSQKLEDLVRLALKRLNVSYLTEYRHVWYGLRRGRSRVSVVESKIERPFPPVETWKHSFEAKMTI